MKNINRLPKDVVQTLHSLCTRIINSGGILNVAPRMFEVGTYIIIAFRNRTGLAIYNIGEDFKVIEQWDYAYSELSELVKDCEIALGLRLVDKGHNAVHAF